MPKPTYTETINQSRSKEGLKRSVPFIASVAGYNANSHSFKDISRAWDLADIEDLIQSPGTRHDVRILLPSFIKQFIEVRFELKFQCNASQPNRTMKIALARRTVDHSAPVISQFEIDRQTVVLGGPWTLSNGATIELDHVDILQLLRGIASLDETDQFFFISIFFDVAPAAWQSFTKFRVLGSGYIPTGSV